MNFSVANSILLFFFGVTLLGDFASGKLDLNRDGIVGVSQKKLVDYLTKAIYGFQKIIENGDEELNYPPMEPYELQDVSWEHIDTSPSKKFSLSFLNTKPALLKGLSKYRIDNVEASAQDMTVLFDITFDQLQTKFPYKIDGHMFKHFMPVYGEGFVELSTKNQQLYCSVDLNIDQGFIVVERADCYRYSHNIEVKVTGLMDLPDPFSGIVVDDILNRVWKKHGQDALNKYVKNTVEEAVGGMTTDEFFDYLDHFVKKYDEQEKN